MVTHPPTVWQEQLGDKQYNIRAKIYKYNTNSEISVIY